MEYEIKTSRFLVNADTKEEAIENAISMITKDISFLFPIKVIKNE